MSIYVKGRNVHFIGCGEALGSPRAAEPIGAPGSAPTDGTPVKPPGLTVPYTILPMGPAAGEDRAAAHSL